MVAFKPGQAPPAGYHLETQADGSQVLINNQTGQAAIVDPYSGQITGEVPRAQARPAVPAQGPVGGNARVATPAAPGVYNPAGAGNVNVGGAPAAAGSGTPMPGVPGGVYVPGGGPPAQPSGGGPGGVTPRAAGQLSGNVSPRTAPGQPAPPPGGYDNPGSDTYDWYKINDALRASGMDGWQIAGTSHQPVNQGQWVKNPSYDSLLTPQENKDAGNGDEYTFREGSDYVIGVVNPTTNQLVKVHLSKTPSPDGAGHYNYGITSRETQGALDKTQSGYTGVQRLSFGDGHEELWGTNSQTGAFEKMPTQPENLGNLKGWSDVKQIESNGQLVWVGTNPQGVPLQPIPGAPTVNTSKYVPGSVKQVQVGNQLVYRGQNPQTGVWEDIPSLGSEVVQPKTTTVGKNVYTTDANGNLVLASAIAQPREGNDQWVDAGTGYAKHQIFSNGDWHDDPDTPQKAVSPATQRAEGALKPKGTKYWIPLSGSPDKMIEVTADGNGGYTYEPGPTGEPPRTMTVPGIREPTEVTGGGTSEFYPQRRDPYTGQLLPLERNPNWSPTNVGDRVRQLQDQARAKQQDLHSQVVAGSLTEDQANQQFNTWWADTVEPAKQEIQLAQQWKQEDQNRQNLATAQTGASEITRAIAGEHRVGPGFGAMAANIQNSFATGKFPQAMSAQDLQNAFVTPMPNYQDIYEQATARALQHISPTAAQIATGQPVPTGLGQLQNMDVTAGLSQSRYMPGVTPPPPVASPAPPVAPAPAPVAPAPAPAAPYDWAALQQRLLQDQLQQRLQASAYTPPTYQPAF
jgi:hypothetical protein